MDTSSLLQIAVLMMSIVIHECAHGWVALRSGDPTAKFAGRLTLNPIPHIDIIGTIILPTFLVLSNAGILFGWAKPVPVNHKNLKNPRLDSLRVAIAGPISNIIIATACTFGIVIAVKLFGAPRSGLAVDVLTFGIRINIILALFNMLPVFPLDGSYVLEYFIPNNFVETFRKVQRFGPIILMLIVFSRPIFGTSIFNQIIVPPYIFLFDIYRNIVSFFGV